MELDVAVSKVKLNSELENILNDTVLCSALSFLSDWKVDYWELNYYKKSDDKIIQISVNDDGASFKTEGEPFKKHDICDIDINDVCIMASNALDIAKKHYHDKYKSLDFTKLFLSLHGGKVPLWSVSIITKTLMIVHIMIDSKSGEITKSEAHALFDKNKLKDKVNAS